MSQKILFIFQFAYLIWPLFVITALTYSIQFRTKRGWLRQLGQRIHTNLLYTWLVLLAIWVVTLFAETETPTLIPEPANSLIFFGGLGLLVLLELLRLRALPLRIRARVDLHEAHGLAYLRQLDPDHFEELVAETYRALGNTAWRVGKSGDHGIDVEVRTPKGERWIVQCKRYRDSVGESIVRELFGTLTSEGAERGVLVTSAEITPPAAAWAADKPIDLVDGPALLRLIERARRKTAGSLFDRLAGWLSGLFMPAQPAAALRAAAAAREETVAAPRRAQSYDPDHTGATQPVRDRQTVFNFQPDSPPESIPDSQPRICPSCGAQLAIHPGRPGRVLYRCTRYPHCRVVLDG